MAAVAAAGDVQGVVGDSPAGESSSAVELIIVPNISLLFEFPPHSDDSGGGFRSQSLTGYIDSSWAMDEVTSSPSSVSTGGDSWTFSLVRCCSHWFLW